MKVTPKAEKLVKEISEMLWDNNLKLSLVIRRYDVINDLRATPITLVPPHMSQSEWVEREIRDSVDMLFSRIEARRNLRWLHKLRADIEATVRINQLTDSFLTEKKTEQFEALRSRVMVKAVQASVDNTDMFRRIVKTDSEKDLRSVEKWIDTKCVINPNWAVNR